MNNEAISSILEHLCNEARNSAHATFGALELLRDTTSPPLPEALALEASGSDRLLRFIDDVRELTRLDPPKPSRLEEFDLVVSAGAIVEGLNLISKRRSRRMILETSLLSLPVVQDRAGVEQVLTRMFNTAFKLTRTSEVHIRLTPNREGNGAWAVIGARDADLARGLIHWLKMDPAKAVLPEPNDVAFGVAIMAAGRRLRALGGSAELECDAVGHMSVALNIPSLQHPAESETPDFDFSQANVTPSGALNVLVVEDCDESFVLSEVALQHERLSRARDGEEALHKIHRQRFDLVLMDVHMPGKSGYEVIRDMRDWETETGNARTPIVVLSSDDLETQRSSAAQSGCSGFLRKPLHRVELVGLLDRLRDSRVLVH